MLNPSYLHALSYDPLDPSWPREIAPVTLNFGQTRYLCTYEDGKRHKPMIFSLLEKNGQKEGRATWDLHHIVEGQHYADIDFRGMLDIAYKTELPCVLIANEEHRALNSLLHCKETDELWRDSGLPSDLRERSQAAKVAAQNFAAKSELRQRITGLANFYKNAYIGRPVLQQVAQNVFDEALRRLG